MTDKNKLDEFIEKQKQLTRDLLQALQEGNKTHLTLIREILAYAELKQDEDLKRIALFYLQNSDNNMKDLGK